MTAPSTSRVATPFSRQLRLWRTEARLSQLDLALRAGVSQRYVSFIETGRSRPGADVVRRVGEALGIPLRDRNRLLEAAGLPPAYPEVPLAAEAVAPFRQAVDRLLQAHEPYPAFVLDRWWDVVAVNQAAAHFFPIPVAESGSSVGPGARPSAIEAFLAPGGLREHIDNFPEVASMYVRRLQDEVAEASDERLRERLAKARALVADVVLPEPGPASDLVICPRLIINGEIVRTVTMVARFGATREVTLDELRVELVFPADEAAESFFRRGAMG